MSTTKKVAIPPAALEKKTPPKKRVRKPVAKKAVPKVPLKAQTPILSTSERAELSGGISISPAVSRITNAIVSVRSEQIVSKMSRTAGTIIASIGILYTFFSAPFTSAIFNQQAQVIDSATTTEQTLDCTTYENFLNKDCRELINTQPHPELQIEPGAITANKIVFRVHAPHAEQVKLRFRDTLGAHAMSDTFTMQKSDTVDDWRVEIDTTKLANSKYVPQFVVKNFYTTYEAYDTAHPFLIKNIEAVESVPVSEATTVIDSASTTATATKVTVKTPNLTSATDFKFFIVTSNPVQKVILTAKNVASGKIVTLGEAYKESETNWSLLWQTKDAPLGYYQIYARAVTPEGEITNDSLRIKKTVIATVATTTEPTIPPVTLVAPVLRPPVSVSLPSVSSLKASVPIRISVAHASSVELSITPKASLTSRPLGKAYPLDGETWQLSFDTTQIPDGEYSITVRIRNTYGNYEYVKNGIVVRNITEPVYSTEQAEKIAALKAVANEVAPKLPLTPTPVKPVATTTDEVKGVARIAALAMEDTSKKELRSEFDRLGVAVRLGDEAKIAEIKSRIETYAKESSGTEAPLRDILASAIEQTKEETKRVDTLLAKRTSIRANEDSDHDSVSNYDEVAIYKTNPYAPDTDNDGFLDGVEILKGYDPLSAKAEVLIQYESPHDTGIVREDILQVTSISTVPVLDTEASSTQVESPAALISGKALPNSFVTLYIFSTPIVVTVKTDADGSWNYHFDKELEDGAHEIFVGVTDNAGKIIAKSNSFAFIKEAQAFTGTEPIAPSVSQNMNEGQLTSDYTIYWVLGISTLAIGLVLMLLGFQLRGRKIVLVETVHYE